MISSVAGNVTSDPTASDSSLKTMEFYITFDWHGVKRFPNVAIPRKTPFGNHNDIPITYWDIHARAGHEDKHREWVVPTVQRAPYMVRSKTASFNSQCVYGTAPSAHL